LHKQGFCGKIWLSCRIAFGRGRKVLVESASNLYYRRVNTLLILKPSADAAGGGNSHGLRGLSASLTVMAAMMLLAVSFMLLSPAAAAAYTVEQHDDEVTGDILITPTKVELNLDPGDKTTAEIKVINRTGEAATFEFSTEDFEGSDDPSQATVFMGDEESPIGARGWLKPEIESIVLQHGETLTFKVDVAVPSDATPGGHYAVLFASRTVDRYQEEAGVKFTSRVGTLFLITVSGEIIESGSLDPPEVPKLSEYGPIDIGLVFNNEGNVHLKPSGKVIIRNFFGREVAEIDVREWVVLPEASRRTLVQWDGHRLIGRYTATAELSFGSDGMPVYSQSSFWVIPWKIVLAVVLALLAAIILILLWRRRSSRSQMRQLEMEQEIERLKKTSEEEPPAAAATPPSPETAFRGKRIPLSQLFPSMDDNQVVDIDDPETLSLIRKLIEGEIDLARSYIEQGNKESAKRELMEARGAAWRIGLLSEVGVIDDMLQGL
jgi:hypothetical protein